MLTIRRVAVIGANHAGQDLALRASRAGFETTLEDILPARLRRIATAPGAAHPLLRYASSIEDAVRAVDLVIDTVPDELESKLEILTLLDRMAPPQALFATPTSALSIADLASCTYRPAQCFALYLDTDFPGAETLRVAIRYPPACLPQTLAAVERFFTALGAVVTTEQDTAALP